MESPLQKRTGYGLATMCASGNLPSDCDRLLSTLTPREREVLNVLLFTADSRKQAAHRLKISRHTWEVHQRSVYAKLGVHSRTELILIYSRQDADTPAHSLLSDAVR